LEASEPYSEILYERLGPVTRISHNRPAQRNAESERLLAEFDDAFARAERDPETRVVILAGTGDHFSAGHDIKEGLSRRAGAGVEERWVFEEKVYFGYAMRIWDIGKPTIAQVQGACVAGAFVVANMCDLMVASEDAFFADPVLHSFAAAAVEVLIHPYVLGARAAKDMLFTGRKISAEEGYRLGMVSRLVKRTELETATLALAEQIAKAPPFALKLAKRSINRTLDLQGFRDALNAHFETHQLSHASSESRRMMEAPAGSRIEAGKRS
jgi:enoyl-CoA hydratase